MVEAVRARLNVAEIIGEHVELIPNGRGFKARCPFHDDKTPSLVVDPQRGVYHCFGCQAGGSVFDFVMAREGLSFGEALRMLGRRVGIAVGDRRQHAAQASEERGRQALTEAQTRYHAQLLEHPAAEAARRYLEQRQIDAQAIARFGLGYALDDWHGIERVLTAAGFEQQVLLATGLIKKHERGHVYDSFRGRLMFPVLDTQGQCVGFGARALSDEQQPKYLNTAETTYYRKQRLLYGLHQGREALRKRKRVLLTEGYLDVIRLHGQGFAESVATCGTALSAAHLSLIERQARTLYLLFDGDRAGLQASLRAVSLTLGSALDTRVVRLPAGQDPDDFLRQRPPEALERLLGQASPVLTFATLEIRREEGETLAGKQRALERLLPLLQSIRRPLARDLALRYVADLFQVDAQRLMTQLQTSGGNAAPSATARGDARASDAWRAGASSQRGGAVDPRGEGAHDRGGASSGTFLGGRRQVRLQRRFLAYLLRQPPLLALVRSVSPEQIEEEALRALYTHLRSTPIEAWPAAENPESAGIAEDIAAESPWAAALRTIWLDDLLELQATVDTRRDWNDAHPPPLAAEVQAEHERTILLETAITLKKEEKQRILRQVPHLGSGEASLAVRRAWRVHDEIRRLVHALESPTA